MKKYEALLEEIRGYKKVALAFSGGVDSVFLLYSAIQALGLENVLAITIATRMYPKRERERAEKEAKKMGVNHIISNMDEASLPGVVENTRDRCYLCKKAIFGRVKELAGGNDFYTVIDGSNFDDLKDFRPGMKAVKELDIRSPLKEVGMGKDEIRALSKKFDLETWNLPAMACLASRIPYGDRITKEKLGRVDMGEEYLNDLGYMGVRLRNHGNMARIEVGEDDFPRLILEDRDRVVGYLKEIGFDYVSLDLEGYRMGSLNKNI